MNYIIKNNNPDSTAEITESVRGDGIIIADVNIYFNSPVIPKPVSVVFKMPVIDMYSIFSATNTYQRNIPATWNRRTTSSRLAYGAPLHQLVSVTGHNRLTIALSDAMTPCDIHTGVIESAKEMQCEIVFFTQQINQISEYHGKIYLDFNYRRYEESLKAAEKYWADCCGYPSAYIPDSARDCVYSTWYTFHQNMCDEDVIKQCRLAKPLGMNTVIVDDGWQIEYGGKGYTACGDWVPCKSKFPDMKAFADTVHSIGMKVVLWIHLPAIGCKSRHFDEFRDFTLDPDDQTCRNLDPRYPFIREYLCTLLKKNAIEWGLDGYKLDFIDSFRYFRETKLFDERMDTHSIDDGVDKLLSGIVDTLRKWKPDFLVEFRQHYFGPVVRKYGNMIRVADCPNDTIRNHVAGIDLRFMLGKTPVHSDMLMWHTDDPVADCAMQVISTLFLVPQISVKLDEITDDQYSMLRFYLDFRNRHTETLMDGCLTAENPESCYSLVRSDRDGETIAVSYSLPVLRIASGETFYHINATSSDRLYIDSQENFGTKKYEIFNCTGKTVCEGNINMDAGIHGFNVPRGGMLVIR